MVNESHDRSQSSEEINCQLHCDESRLSMVNTLEKKRTHQDSFKYVTDD